MNPHRIKLTADAVAIAVVAAARLTGEDPLTIAARDPEMRCRHLALHALVHCFRGVVPARISAALACPGKASFFYRTSLWYTLGKAPQRDTKPAAWWRDEDLDTVIRAVEQQLEKNEPAAALPPPPPKIEAPARKPPPVPEPPPPIRTKDIGVTRIARVVEEQRKPSVGARSIPDHRDEPPPRRSSPGGISGGKRDLYKMLGDAVRNTAKLPKGD